MKTKTFLALFGAIALLTAGYSSAATADTGDSDVVKEAKMHFSFAVQSRNNENYDEAAKQYEKSIALYDSLYQVHYSYADMLLKNGDKEAALAHFRKAYDLNPDYYNSAVMLSNLYYQTGKNDSVLVMYEHMFSLKPEKTDLLVSIAGLREYLGDTPRALDDYSHAIESGQDSFEVLVKAATLAEKLGKADTVMTFAEKALGKQPEDAEMLRLASKSSLDNGDTAKGLEYCKRLLAVEPTVATAMKLETLSRDANDTNTLIETLERHHTLAPSNAAVLSELAECLYAAGDAEKSIAYVRKGLEIDPKDGRMRIILGEYYRSKNEENKALEQYKLAMNDDRWKSSAQRLAWQIEKPESDEDKKEREFFSRGKQQ